jgi:hypothetical protein
MRHKVRLTESKLHRIIKESVKAVLNELDWKTYMNAARKRKEQGDKIRDLYRKNGWNAPYDTSYDQKSGELEKYAQEVFQKKHGKDGHSHQYDGPYTSYRGRYSFKKGDDSDAEIKAPVQRHTYYDGSFEDGRHYRYGNGTPSLYAGRVVDDTFDHFEGNDEDGFYDRNNERRWTGVARSDGFSYDPNMSSVGDEVSMSKDDDYNKALEDMTNDMVDYYTGKSKYEKGKGWQ